MDYCEDPLVASLPLGSFQSSSRSSDSHSAHFAKLNRKDGAGGWSPGSEDHRPWLQLDLRDRLEITAIATQGRWGSSDWVNSYHLQYSDSGRTWRSYRQDDVPWHGPPLNQKPRLHSRNSSFHWSDTGTAVDHLK
ncbi:hypothetical protein SRHO_G00171620 [Serrasalmus rhombeus]